MSTTAATTGTTAEAASLSPRDQALFDIIEIVTAPSQPWHKKAFPTGQLVQPEHANQVFAHGLQLSEVTRKKASFSLSSAEITTALIEKVHRLRDHARKFGLQKVTAQIIKNAQALGLNNVNGIADLRREFQEHLTDWMAAIIWQSFFGAFDLMRNWEVRLEKEYMETMGYTYLPDTEVNPKTGKVKNLKGCFASLMSEAKNKLVSNFNDVFSKYDTKIVLERAKGTVKGTDVHKKRKPGTCLGPFCYIKGKPYYNPELHIKRQNECDAVVKQRMLALVDKQENLMTQTMIQTPPEPAEYDPKGKSPAYSLQQPNKVSAFR